MCAFFELIDLKSGNLLGDYDTADDALAALVLTAELYGRSAIADFSLMRIHGDDQFLVAIKEDLVSLVDAFARKSKSLSKAS